MKWLCAGRELDCETPLIMGIVNVTPDSFSDGGEHYSCDKAVEHGLKLLEEGADILDIGGESTRPGAPEVPVEEELARVIPVVEQLSETGAILSVDTSKPQVILCAAQAGAHIINDVRALQWPGALDAAASTNLGVCLMHMRGTPKNMQSQTQYADVVEEVVHEVEEQDLEPELVADGAGQAVAALVAPVEGADEGVELVGVVEEPGGVA